MRKLAQKGKWIIPVVCTGAAAILVWSPIVRAGGNEVNFVITDTPGRWFDTGVDIAGTRSLAVATPGVRVNFSGNSNTVHTRSSLRSRMMRCSSRPKWNGSDRSGTISAPTARNAAAASPSRVTP